MLRRISNISLRNKLIFGITLLMLIVINLLYFRTQFIVQEIILHHENGFLRNYAVMIESAIKVRKGEIVFKDDEILGIRGANFIIYNSDGDIIYDKYFFKDINIGLNKYPAIDSVVRHATVTYDGEERRLLLLDKFIKIHGEVYHLRTTRSMKSQYVAIREISKNIKFITFIAVIVQIIGVAVIVRYSLRPVDNIAKAVKKLGGGKYDTRISNIYSKDAIGYLAKSFNEMADNVQSAFEREKQFTTDVSHELRTPLAVILTNAEYAEATNDIDTYKKTNAEIISKAHHMQQLITQLLGLARELEQSSMLELAKVDISTILKDIAIEYEDRANDKSISLSYDIEDSLCINADLMLFTRLIFNLLDNAIKYNVEDGTINISACKQSDNVVIKISDTGIGISESDLPHIFERLYRADKSRTDASYGLGLSFVDMIVRLHKGKIDVVSEKDIGSTFILSFAYC